MISSPQSTAHRSTRTAFPLATVYCPLFTAHSLLTTNHYPRTTGLPPILSMSSGVSNIEQTPAWKGDTFCAMAPEIRILKVEQDGEDGLLVTFSDGTIGGYVVEELLELRPIREAVKKTPAAQYPAFSHPPSIVLPLVTNN